MKRISLPALPGILCVTAWVAFLFGPLSQPVQAQYSDYDPKLQQVAVMVARFLQEEHFAMRPIDESVSREWIQNYMETLDYGHLYFLRSDFDEFLDKHASVIGKKVRYGDITPAFDIFNRFRERFDARVQWVEQRLERPFNFDTQEAYLTDRRKELWPDTSEKADVVWERRLKYELLQSQFAKDSEKNGQLPAIKSSDFKISKEVLKTVRDRHQRRAKYITETDSDDIVETYLSSLTSVFDPHSQYLSQKSYEDFFIAMNQKLFGIGAILSTDEGYCTIREIIKGGPADLSGHLQVKDRITGVAQGDGPLVDIIDMKLRDAVRLIRGKKGTTVRLEVIPARASDSSIRKEIHIVRDEIKLTHQKAQARMIQRPLEDGKKLKLGVIKLPSFYGDIGGERRGFFGMKQRGTSTTDDVASLLDYLNKKNLDGLILDLRNNGGGLLDEAVRLAGLFIDKGPIVQIRDSKNRRRVLEDESPGALYQGPLIVLTNKYSASASEIVAGALQNYGRAVVVGDSSTHGKGTVQTVTEMGRFIASMNANQPSVGAVKLTIQKFYLPNGHSTQTRGVVPDIKLPSPNDVYEIGEATLPHALPWDEIAPASFTMVADIGPIASLLAERSRERIAHSEQFLTLKTDIEELKARLENKTVSLNAAQRIKEILDDQSRNRERKDLIDDLVAASPDVLSIEFDENMNIVEKLETAGESAAKEAETAANGEDALDGDESILNTSPVRDYARDLHLQESLKILSDLITFEKAPEQAVAGSAVSRS